MQYERIITRGNSKDATSRDREIAASRSKALRERYASYLLRREKKDVLNTDRRYLYLKSSGVSGSALPISKRHLPYKASSKAPLPLAQAVLA